MVRPLLVKERVVSSFNVSRTVILTLKTGIAMEERKNSFQRIAELEAFEQDSYQNQEELARSVGVLNKSFQNASWE